MDKEDYVKCINGQGAGAVTLGIIYKRIGFNDNDFYTKVINDEGRMGTYLSSRFVKCNKLTNVYEDIYREIYGNF